MKVIIIGAGIAGLTTAIALSRRGLSFELYERAERLTEIGAGISLWANALDALNRLSIPIQDISQPLSRTELRLDQGRRVSGQFQADQLSQLVSYSPPLAMVHRAELVELLVQHVASENLHFNCELTEVDQTGGQVEVRFRNGARASGDLLIAADGIKSIVRDHIQGIQTPRYSGYTCYRGVSPRPALIDPGYMGEWWGRGLRFGITTLPRDRIYWFATRNASRGEQHTHLARDVRQLFANWADPIQEILATTPDDGFLHNDIVDRSPHPKQCAGRLILIGDAAHATTPNLGQGGCMAIEDSLGIARTLSTDLKGSNIEQLLLTFVQERYARTSTIVRQSYRLGAMGQWQSPIACKFRDWLVTLISQILGPREMVKYARYRVPQ